MCLAIPVCIEAMLSPVQARGHTAEHECVSVDMALVGEVAPGTWVLTFLHAAREVIDATRAASINQALAALRTVHNSFNGADSASEAQTMPLDLDAFFPDLVGREPQLPEFLREPTRHPQ